MLNKLKKTWYADDFSYFIRNFGIFTLIFSAMTLIIIQVMRSSLYTTVDNNLKSLSQDSASVINLALARRVGMEQKSDNGEPKTDTGDKELTDKPNVSANTEVILFDKNYKPIITSNNFLGLNKLSFNSKQLDRIRQVQVKSNYGRQETYRMILFEVKIPNLETNVKYAAVFINISQLEQTSQNHEQLIVVVMISFWGISLIASVYLARVSVKPLLESIQKQKSFVENASHELRTPLAVLQNRLETLFRKPEATIMESSESIASSLDEVRNMKMLTTNLLNLARRDDGIKPEIGDVEPNFFNTTFTNYEMVAAENGKVFRFDNRIHRVIKTDKTLLKQLMTILFDNALKYTDEDGVIELTISANDRNLFLKVSDNGPGISTADKKKIFDRFYRVDKARTRQTGGFGLGLSLAKQITEALKGTIAVKDNKPKGTIFEVKIAIRTDNRKKK
ncbi:sensor histidine kinase [Streptococcus anginosus]|uniref:sensor histidine kinase n=1 Tax=Streptococcus anginosus TaxID=1328 RepID=UPI00195F2471|nr:HAMP domain-containing sensor histidine kinase [Streptococcus anginosus]VTY20518.1 Sensor protein SrrB [Streptococcus anginosus]